MDLRFVIFDVTKPLMSDYPVIKSDTGQMAVRIYLDSIGENDTKFKKGGGFARISAQPIQLKDGIKYRHPNKRTVWYSEIKQLF